MDTVNLASVMAVARLHPDAIPPRRDPSDTDAIGYDLFCLEDVTLLPNTPTPVKSGIAGAAPSGCYIRIAPRSGLSKTGVDVLAGVIDRSYRGDITAMLIWHTRERWWWPLWNSAMRLLLKLWGQDVRPAIGTLQFPKGSRVAQLIVERAETPAVYVTDRLEETARGSKGFGSSGL